VIEMLHGLTSIGACLHGTVCAWH